MVDLLVPVPEPYDLAATLGDLRFGLHDPTMRLWEGGAAKAAWTSAGPVEVHLERVAEGVRARLWGPGSQVVADGLPGLLGLEDDPSALRGADGPVGLAWRRMPGLRLNRVPFWLSEVLVAVILQQRVQWVEAARSHARLVRRWSEAAPGPGGLHLPVHPSVLARLSSAAWFEAGVDHRRAGAVRHAMVSYRRLDALGDVELAEVRRRLLSLPGVGPWTVETTVAMALGDPDAVPVGDYSLPDSIAWALAGEPRADDARMLELLEPYRGQRYRAIRLLLATSGHAPRYGPRLERPGPPRRRAAG